MIYTKSQIEAAVLKNNYTWFNGSKDYDLNIVGIRNTDTGNNVTNLFDDILTVSYKEKGKWVIKQYPFTTDPGKKAVLNVRNPKGVARVVEGQYRSAYELGLHRGKYEALVQQNPISVYRDKNKNMLFDSNKIETGIFGINIHRSSPTGVTTFVEDWSEGCQVFAKISDYNEFISICRKAAKIYGNNFTYTLIKSSDIK